MLKQRIITALILLPIMLIMLFWSPHFLWEAFTALIALLALWEYGRMCGFNSTQQTQYLIGSTIFLLLAGLGDWQLPALAWLAVLGFWAGLMPLWLKHKWRLAGGWQAAATGWMLMLPFWFALSGLRGDNPKALLAIMGLVWIADIFAYFCGRLFGRHKIAPAISPGKTWEGAIGGAVFVLIYMNYVRDAGWLTFNAPWLVMAIVALILTAVSVCGDLLESWLKRAAGVKDSSQLLPGHGGVFDRVDSLIAVLSVYAAIIWIF